MQKKNKEICEGIETVEIKHDIRNMTCIRRRQQMAGPTHKYQKYVLSNEEYEMILDARDKLKKLKRCIETLFDDNITIIT